MPLTGGGFAPSHPKMDGSISDRTRQRGAYRQEMLDRLYRYYGKYEGASDFNPEKWAGAENLYWKNLLRTMDTPELEAFYKARLGQPPEMEG